MITGIRPDTSSQGRVFGHHQHATYPAQSATDGPRLIHQIIDNPVGKFDSEFSLMRSPRGIRSGQMLPPFGGLLLTQRDQPRPSEQRNPIQRMSGRLIVERNTDRHCQATTGAEYPPDFGQSNDQVRSEEQGIAAPHRVDRTVRQASGGEITLLEMGSRRREHYTSIIPGDAQTGLGEIDADQVAAALVGQPKTRRPLTAGQIQEQMT